MTALEFLARQAAEKNSPKLCSCGCNKPLEPRVDGVRQTINGKEVNDDCYFDNLGELVEKHPIKKPR